MTQFHVPTELPKEKLIEVINYVTSQKEIRTSDLQKKFLWGYYRAGHTMDKLVSLNIVADFNGLLNRKVLMSNVEVKSVIDGLP